MDRGTSLHDVALKRRVTSTSFVFLTLALEIIVSFFSNILFVRLHWAVSSSNIGFCFDDSD